MPLATTNKPPSSLCHRGIVEEKESGLRQLLVVMGLRPWVLSASWALTYLLLLALVAALSVAVLTSSFLAGTSPSLLLAYFGAFALSEVAFGLLVATLFGSAKAAAVVGPLAHFAAVMPRYVFVKTGGQAGGSGQGAL